MTHVGSFLDLIFGVATRLTRIGTNLYIADKSKLNDRDGHCSDRKSPDSETSSGVDSPRAHNMNAKELRAEMYFGYFLVIITTIGLVFLIHGQSHNIIIHQGERF
jgi:hypothetical protein